MFKKDDYIVVTKEHKGHHGELNYCYKVLYTSGDYIYFERSSCFDSTKVEPRYATKEEIAEYERIGKPYDVTTLKKEFIYEENEYYFLQIGTPKYIFKCAGINKNYVSSFYNIFDDKFRINSSDCFYRLDSPKPTEIRKATEEEIQWLEACVKANKFVSLEDSKLEIKSLDEKDNPPFKIGDKVFLEKHYKTDLETKDYSKNIPLNTELIVKNILFETGVYGNGKIKKWCVYLKDYPLAHPAEKFKPISEMKSNNQDLLEEAKKRYPIGTKFKNAKNDNIDIIRDDTFVFYHHDSYKSTDIAISPEIGTGLVYFNGWAEIIGKPLKPDNKVYTYEVVNCTTQEEWDFVLSKNNPLNLSKSSFNYDKSGNTCFVFKGKDPFTYCNLSYFEENNSRILSFEEWCKEFGYSFKESKSNFIVGETVLYGGKEHKILSFEKNLTACLIEGPNGNHNGLSYDHYDEMGNIINIPKSTKNDRYYVDISNLSKIIPKVDNEIPQIKGFENQIIETRKFKVGEEVIITSWDYAKIKLPQKGIITKLGNTEGRYKIRIEEDQYKKSDDWWFSEDQFKKIPSFREQLRPENIHPYKEPDYSVMAEYYGYSKEEYERLLHAGVTVKPKKQIESCLIQEPLLLKSKKSKKPIIYSI